MLFRFRKKKEKRKETSSPKKEEISNIDGKAERFFWLQ
jgi:hypothetical protein